MPKGWTRPIITSANPNLKQWRELVAVAAGEAMVAQRSFDGPVLLRAWFYLPRPKSMARKVVQRTRSLTSSKLVRAPKDALKAVVWVDDSQVVALEASKHYAVNEPVGVAVEVEAL